MRTFAARTERVVGPGVIDALLGLPFAVFVSRRVEIIGAPECPPILSKQAMHCLVILCGGKRLLIAADEDQRSHTIRARVGVLAKRPPPDCQMHDGSTALLDVGVFLALVQRNGYAVRDVLVALNGD